jgi:hypothetical protein
MPAGMWVKNLAYLQFGKTAIVFTQSLKGRKMLDLAAMLEWQKADIQLPGSHQISSNELWNTDSTQLAKPEYSHSDFIRMRAK